MREVAFIKNNKEKWLEFEKAIFGKQLKNVLCISGKLKFH